MDAAIPPVDPVAPVEPVVPVDPVQRVAPVVLAKRERMMLPKPWQKGLIGTTLRFASEVRDTATYFDELRDIAVPADMLALAEHILESKAADLNPPQFRDRYEDAVVAMLKAKQASRPAATQAPRFATARSST